VAKEKSELYEWLSEQGTAGSRDSEGTFTLKHDDAWAKLGAFQLPVEEGWVLKVIQAVNAAPKARVRITQLARETIFTVSGVDHWNREAVEDTIFSITKDGGTDIGHLGAAVRLLAQMRTRPFSVRYCDAEKVIWTGEKFSAMTSSVDNLFELRVGHFSFQERGRLLNLAGTQGPAVSANIAGSLRRHCHLSREPLVLDGYFITSGENDQNLGTPAGGRPLALLQVWDECELPTFELASTNRAPVATVGAGRLSLDRNVATELSGNKPCYCGGLLSVFVKKGNPHGLGNQNSRILWLNDGVIVHRESLPVTARPIALGIIVSSEGLETDISGMVPRETSEYFRRRKLALQQMHRHLEKLIDKLGRELVTTSISKAPVAVSGTGLLLSFANPYVGTAVLIAGGVSYLLNRSQLGELDKRVDQELRNLHQDLKQLAERVR